MTVNVRRGAAPWRRLLPLAVAVLAVHALLLQVAPRHLRATREEPVRFVTRLVTPRPPAPRVDEAAAPAPTPAAPVPAPPRRPEPQPPSATPAAPAPALPPAPAAAPAAPPPAASMPPVVATAPEVSQLPPARTGTPAPAVQALPDPAHIHYEVEVQARGFTLRGRARFDWRHDGQTYEARLELSSPLLPTRVQRSTGRVGAEGLVPEYFSDKGSRSEQATHFDRDRQRLVFSNNQPEAPLAEGMQDRLSVIVQLSVLIAAQPAQFPPGTQIAIPTASTREAETWMFAVEGEEDLDLPGGRVHALKLQRLPRKTYDQKVELWLAPRMDYAPVRLRLTNPNGDAVDQRWSSTDKG